MTEESKKRRYRRKEKELTEEEAMKLALEQAKPFWINSVPLFSATSLNGQSFAFPLNDQFIKENWIMVFVDPISYGYTAVYDFAKTLRQRYERYGMKQILVLSCPYPPSQRVTTLTKQLDLRKAEVPVVFDHDGQISKAFKIDEQPCVALFKEGKIQSKMLHFKETQFEKIIQQDLRIDNPGLALEPPLALSSTALETEVQWSFLDPNVKSGIGPIQDDTAIEPGKIYTTGNWKISKSMISTQDPTSELNFMIPCSSFGIIASSLKRTADPTKIEIEVDDGPVFEKFSDSDLILDDDGRSIVEITNFKLYHVTKDTPADKRLIRLRFSNVKRNGIIIYALHFFG